MSQEAWRPVLFDSHCRYEVSSLGRVRSALDADGRQAQFAGRIKSPNIQNSGYFVVWLQGRSKHHIRLVHRLVAEAFCPRPAEVSVVNHINGDKLDNRADNLEWVTQQQNVDHAVDTGLVRDLTLTSEQVILAQDLYTKERWTQKKIAALLGVTDVLISQLLRGQLKRYTTKSVKNTDRHTANR